MKNKLTFISSGRDGHFARIEQAGKHGIDFFLRVSPFGCWNITYGEEKLAFSVPTACEAPAAFLKFAKGYLGKFTVVI